RTERRDVELPDGDLAVADVDGRGHLGRHIGADSECHGGDCTGTTKPPAQRPAASITCDWTSDHANVLSLITLATGGHIELDVLAFLERLVAITLNVGGVDEYVLLTFERDEAEALLGVEEFHCSCSQLPYLLFAGVSIGRA